MTVSKLSTWREFFLQNKYLSNSNKLLKHIRDASDPSLRFTNSFEEISKNPGNGFLILDSANNHMLVFHNPNTFGGSWTNPSRILAAVKGFERDAKPIEIDQQSVKDFKGKSHSLHELTLGSDSNEDFEKLRNPRVEIFLKNIIPIPVLLIQVFLELPSKDPTTVAVSFLKAMFEYDEKAETSSNPDSDIIESDNHINDEAVKLNQDRPYFLDHLLHVIQFCHLCAKGKVPPIHYSHEICSKVNDWFSTLKASVGLVSRNDKEGFSVSKHKRSHSQYGIEDRSLSEDDRDEISSPDLKVSKKD